MTFTILHGSNLDILPTLPDNSVDSIVTDPPYELGFMGKKWDSSGIAYSVELWTECLRVLKPGGHLLSFGGSRTYHRMVVGIEDAGFEVRDMISWISNKTFPKSLDVSKAIDKAAGAEREIVTSYSAAKQKGSVAWSGKDRSNGQGSGFGETAHVTIPKTPEAQEWKGWGTGLKPTVEPIVMARKPLIGTVAYNVLTHGTGALNIDGSRIGTEVRKNNFNDFSNQHGNQFANGKPIIKTGETKVTGRWPANIILDEHTAGLLDEQSGVSKSPATYVRNKGTLEGERVAYPNIGESAGAESLNYGDSGGASRFFYVAKANKRDRNEGLGDLPEAQTTGGGGLTAEFRKDGSLETASAGGKYGSIKAKQSNTHPTVKPTALMEYLVKLVTPPNGTVLDPFTGSGSTGKAAILNGFDFIGIEMTEDYLPIIDARLKHAEATYGSQIRID